MFKIVMTSDDDIKRAVMSKLEKNREEFGKRYCPCALEKTDDTVCMCKAFREQDFEGECHCGLYEKVMVN